jgi:hypothetical protein
MRAGTVSAKIRDVLRRIFLSALAAVPSAFFSFGLADSAKTPSLVRYLIAPGYVLMLHVRLSLDNSIWLALWTNSAHYGLLIYLISHFVDAHAISRSSEEISPTKLGLTR